MPRPCSLDLALPVNGSIDRASPAWTNNLLDLYVGTVDAFLKYDNLLAFNVGNEVVTAPADTISAPFIKAAARDIKAYLYVRFSFGNERQGGLIAWHTANLRAPQLLLASPPLMAMLAGAVSLSLHVNRAMLILSDA